MKKNISKILIGIAIVLIVIAGVVFGIYFFGDKQNTNDVISLGTDIVNNNEENNQPNEEVTKKSINIFSGTERPYAVMIDNHLGALPQAGLNKAYIV